MLCDARLEVTSLVICLEWQVLWMVNELLVSCLKNVEPTFTNDECAHRFSCIKFGIQITKVSKLYLTKLCYFVNWLIHVRGWTSCQVADHYFLIVLVGYMCLSSH